MYPDRATIPCYLCYYMKKRYLILAVVPLAFIWVAAIKKAPTPNPYAETITAADLRTHLTILASDEYEGRETGQPGQKKAAQYISDFYKSIGIPAQKDGTWLQEVKLVKISGGTSSFEIKDSKGAATKFQQSKDYFFAAQTPGVNISTNEFVFVGYGIDDPKYSDYSAHDSAWYAGKILVMLDGEPSDKGVYRITGNNKPGMWTIQRRAKLNAARNRKAKAMLIIPADYAKSKDAARHNIEGYSLVLDEPEVDEEAPMPVIYINGEMANTIFARGGQSKTTDELRQMINSSGTPQSFVANTPGTIIITRNEEKLTTENVLGYVEGTDLKDELIVVTAHYDHLGIHDGVVFNGADDDGSGTVAVMELAQAFMQAKQDGQGPRRSMLFMTVSGEEKGLLGSSWYTRHPVYPLESTMCNLNIDMIGRVDEEHSKDSNFVYVIGSDKISPDLRKSIESNNKKYCKLKLDYRFDDDKDPNMFYYRSDHYNFAKNGIPVAFFFNGTHEDYHKESDEVSKINFSLMQKRARLVFYTAWDLANRNKPLARKLAKK
jgi:hypothetical protein